MYGNGYECSGQNLSLEVANFGLGSVWSNITSIEERMNKIREIFDLKDGLYHFNISSIGYLAEALENKFIDKYDESRVHYEKY